MWKYIELSDGGDMGVDGYTIVNIPVRVYTGIPDLNGFIYELENIDLRMHAVPYIYMDEVELKIRGHRSQYWVTDRLIIDEAGNVGL